jgi:Mor family transcriptional regulator
LRYVNAKDVLPPDVLTEVQKHTCGVLIYIPKKDCEKAGWGQINGTRALVSMRNRCIIEAYRNGTPIIDLMDMYYLSEASIRKIIYSKANIKIEKASSQ